MVVVPPVGHITMATNTQGAVKVLSARFNGVSQEFGQLLLRMLAGTFDKQIGAMFNSFELKGGLGEFNLTIIFRATCPEHELKELINHSVVGIHIRLIYHHAQQVRG